MPKSVLVMSRRLRLRRAMVSKSLKTALFVFIASLSGAMRRSTQRELEMRTIGIRPVQAHAVISH